MSQPLVYIILLIPLAVVIAYYDVRYRRIPNALSCRLQRRCFDDAILGGLQGVYSSITGCALAFFLCSCSHFRRDGSWRRQTFRRNWRDNRRAVSGAHFHGCSPNWGLLQSFHYSRRILITTMHRVVRVFAECYQAGRCRSSQCLGPQTHDSLWSRNHNGQHHLYSYLSYLKAAPQHFLIRPTENTER